MERRRRHLPYHTVLLIYDNWSKQEIGRHTEAKIREKRPSCNLDWLWISTFCLRLLHLVHAVLPLFRGFTATAPGVARGGDAEY